MIHRAWVAPLLLAGVGCSPRIELSAPAGTTLLSNIDDDDGDGIRDGLDTVVNGENDLLDLLPIEVRARCRGELRLTLAPPENVEHLNLFLGSTWVAGDKRAGLALPCGNHRLFVEARRTRSSLWDGRISVQVTTSEAQASLALRVAPVTFPDATRQPLRVLLAQPLGGSFALRDAVIDAGVPVVATAVDGDDRWVQDALSLGEQRVGFAQVIALQMDRPSTGKGLERFVTSLLGPDRGLARPGRDAPNPMSWGGNVEVVPPYGTFPQGRLIVGVGVDRKMGPSTAAWLDAQEVQGPALEVPTGWLETGHVDEIVSFAPAMRPPGFVVFLASTRLASSRLKALVSAGAGTATLYTDEGLRQADDLVDDQGVAEAGAIAQGQLDRIALVFQETGAPVIELPQLYRIVPQSGRLTALTAPMVNLIVLGRRVLTMAADGDGGVFEPLVRTSIEPHGLDVSFVDVRDAYHRYGGGLHCGTEVERSLP